MTARRQQAQVSRWAATVPAWASDSLPLAKRARLRHGRVLLSGMEGSSWRSRGRPPVDSFPDTSPVRMFPKSTRAADCSGSRLGRSSPSASCRNLLRTRDLASRRRHRSCPIPPPPAPPKPCRGRRGGTRPGCSARTRLDQVSRAVQDVAVVFFVPPAARLAVGVAQFGRRRLVQRHPPLGPIPRERWCAGAVAVIWRSQRRKEPGAAAGSRATRGRGRPSLPARRPRLPRPGSGHAGASAG